MALKNPDLEYDRKKFVAAKVDELLKSVDYPQIDSNRKALIYISENKLFLSVETLYRVQRKSFDEIINPNQIKLEL
jgi:hypothetical protein